MFDSLIICLFLLRYTSAFEVGSCTMTMTCSDQFSMQTPNGVTPNSGPFPRAGKRGPKGDKGDRGSSGSIGSKGEPAVPCICPEHTMLLERIETLEKKLNNIHSPQNCRDVLPRRQESHGGVYTIYPLSKGVARGVDVYCDTETDGGGWIVNKSLEHF